MSNSDKFDPIQKLELWEANDHYVLQMIPENSLFSSQFEVRMTSDYVKVLCKIFGIAYDPLWFITLFNEEENGCQLSIRKMELFSNELIKDEKYE
jgi:hypothetical protein